MIQLERLLIPFALGIEDLATFAVVAAVVLTPFRTLEMGIASTLTARLCHAKEIPERWRLLRQEGVMLLVVSCIGGVGIIWLGPQLCRLVLPNKEGAPVALVAALVISGMARIVAAITRALASAFCTGNELQLVNVGGWLAVGIGAAAGYALATFGLAGLVYGVTIGWMVRAGLSALVVHKYLRHEVSVRVPQ
jgi:O-antigen/teichoic acid export membrane protein